MSEAPDTEAEVLAPAEKPAAEAPEAAQAAETPTEGAEAAEARPEPEETAPEPERKPKSPIAQLQGRVGHLTKTIHQKDEALTEANRQIDAYRALLSAQGKLPEADEGVAAPAGSGARPAPGSAEFDQLVMSEAQKVAAQREFDTQCNAIAETGKEKYGAAFEEGVANLNALGLLNVPVVQAAIATGAAPDVINALGADVDEAARIAGLGPVQMGVELAKLALKLQSPKDAKQVSRAPAPIKPVGGAATVETDVYDPNLSMEEYIRRRKAQGSRWAK